MGIRSSQTALCRCQAPPQMCRSRAPMRFRRCLAPGERFRGALRSGTPAHRAHTRSGWAGSSFSDRAWSAARGAQGFVARAARDGQMGRECGPDGPPSRAAAEARQRTRASVRSRHWLSTGRLPPLGSTSAPMCPAQRIVPKVSLSVQCEPATRRDRPSGHPDAGAGDTRGERGGAWRDETQ